MIYGTEKLLDENKDKIDEGVAGEVKAKVEAVKTAQESDSAETIRAAIKELETAMHKVSEQLYQGAGPGDEASQGPPPEGEAASADGDDVVDADFTVNDG